MATEAKNPGAFILSEGSGVISRDTVTLASGQNLESGTVLGKVTATGKYKAYASGNTDGSETAAAILYQTTDATADTPVVVVSRMAEVDEASLTGLDADAKGHLADLNIIVR